MEQRVSLITLGVRDLERARAFYETGLGWRASGVSTGDVVFFQIGTMVLGLYPLSALAAEARLTLEPGSGGMALAHNVRARGEVDAMLAEAEAAGATITRPAAETFWGGYAGYFTDPDGHLWEVAWNPHWPLGEDGAIQLPG